MISPIGGILKKDINELIYKTEIDSKNLWLLLLLSRFSRVQLCETP